MKRTAVIAAISLLLCQALVASPDKALVVYFSATGNTEEAAGKIAAMAGADIARIMPEVPYTPDDLDYRNASSRASRESADAAARPAILPMEKDAEAYDTIFLGFPIWFGDMPKAVYAFLDEHDLSGKRIAPFCTSGSSGIAAAERSIREMEPEAEILSGERISMRDTGEDIASWLSRLGTDRRTI